MAIIFKKFINYLRAQSNMGNTLGKQVKLRFYECLPHTCKPRLHGVTKVNPNNQVLLCSLMRKCKKVIVEYTLVNFLDFIYWPQKLQSIFIVIRWNELVLFLVFRIEIIKFKFILFHLTFKHHMSIFIFSSYPKLF